MSNNKLPNTENLSKSNTLTNAKKSTPVTLHLSETNQVTVDLEELKEEMRKSFYIKSGLWVGK